MYSKYGIRRDISKNIWYSVMEFLIAKKVDLSKMKITVKFINYVDWLMKIRNKFAIWGSSSPKLSKISKISI